jgi:hypothetical protein
MAFLTSLLPGVREVRAPLVAGYLWVLFGWLVADPSSPDEARVDLYDRLSEVLRAIGPVGQAVAVSILAFLLGSVLTTVAIKLFQWAIGRWRGRRLYASVISPHNETGRISPEDLALLAGVGPGEGYLPGWRGYMAGPSPDPSLDRAILAMSDRELGEERRRLESALESIAVRAKDDSVTLELRSRGAAEVVAFEVSQGDSYVREEFVVPTFSAARDLFAEFPVLRTRLVEQAQTTGNQIERIHAEAEFRFAVAVPLVALSLLFATVNRLWLVALLAPIALLVQGLSLEREGDRQTIDALRARSGTPEMELITPVFARYRNDAHRLTDGLENAHWQPG